MAKKILLIDDEKDILDIMRKQIQRAGYETHTACNGKQGLETAQQLHPHLVLTDIGMPVMDGITFYNELKSRPGLSHIPVIVISAYGSPEEDLRRRGVKDYLIKPFNTEILLQKVASFFTQQKAMKVLIATKMLYLMRVIIEEAVVPELEIDLMNDQSAVTDKAMVLKPDLILLDVDMFTAFSAPGTVNYLRKQESLKETRILLIRGMDINSAESVSTGEEKLIKECLAAGASHYVGRLNRRIFSELVREYCR